MNSARKLLYAGGAALAAQCAISAMVRARRRIDVYGKVAVIFGGSRGLGLDLARELGAQGARVAISARDPAELERARAELESAGVDAFSIPCDVRSREEVDGAIAGIRRHFGAIDILINDAGIIGVGPLDSMRYEDFDDAMRTHFYGPLHTTLAVREEFIRRGSGRIVNISSIGGRIAVPHLAPYSASKFALVGFSRSTRNELIRHGVYVTTVCPGLMRTGSPRNAKFKGDAAAEYSWFATSANVPVLTISSAGAARRIIRAMQHGQAELVFPIHMAVQAALHGAFPGVSAEVMGVVNRMLPEGNNPDLRAGRDVAPEAEIPYPLRGIDESAARLHNE